MGPDQQSDEELVLRTALAFKTPWFILATTPILGFWIFVFWGARNLTNSFWFFVGTFGTALAWSLQGWEPWNMALSQVMRGRALKPEEYSPIQRVVVEFFKTPRLRVIQGAWIAGGAVTPWLISGVSLLVGVRPYRPWSEQAQWWVMLIFGIGEAIRGRAIALYVLAGELEKCWPELSRRVRIGEPNADTRDPS